MKPENPESPVLAAIAALEAEEDEPWFVEYERARLRVMRVPPKPLLPQSPRPEPAKRSILRDLVTTIATITRSVVR